MKLFLALSALLAFAAASSFENEAFVQREFRLFEAKFDKVYRDQAEREERYQVFKDNLRTVQEHNLSGLKWREGVNKFFDLTKDEFVSQHLNGYVNMNKPATAASRMPSKVNLKDLPESVDWRDKGAVTDVKDQGSCGSCWAFATVECIESYVLINNGTCPELSTQHITSCTPNELSCGGTGGCKGSIPNLGFTYTQLFGLTTEKEWPYQSGNNGQDGECDFDGNNYGGAAATIRGYELLPRNSYSAVMEHLANKGPLSIAADASAWSFYFGGVFDGCPTDRNIALNHAVQLVGYGTDADEGDYWIVRNSWGSGWGEDGYIRLARHSDGDYCGVDSTPLSGTACVNDGNDEQYVCGTCGTLFDVTYPIGAQLL